MNELFLWFWVAVGGASGALLRFWTTRFSTYYWGSSIPATFVVNCLGCFLLAIGLVWLGANTNAHAQPNGDMLIWLELGFIGGFTTFSMFAVEVQTLFTFSRFKAFSYVFGSFLTSLAALFLGDLVGGFTLYG